MNTMKTKLRLMKAERDRLDGCIRDLEAVSGRLTAPRVLLLMIVQQMAQKADRERDAQVAKDLSAAPWRKPTALAAERDAQVAKRLSAVPWRKPTTLVAEENDSESAEVKQEVNKSQVAELQAARVSVMKASEEYQKAHETYMAAFSVSFDADEALNMIRRAPVKDTDAEAQAWRKHVELDKISSEACMENLRLERAYNEAQQRLCDIEKEV